MKSVTTIIIGLAVILSISDCATRKENIRIGPSVDNVNDSTDTDFLPVDSFPVRLTNIEPKYPIEALQAGIEGVVWIKVCVDTLGNLTDAMIAKDSGKNVGFEEATIEAARHQKWKPAIADGKPVAVWVTFKTEFNIKNK